MVRFMFRLRRTNSRKRRHAATVRAAAHEFKAHVVCDAAEDVGIAVPAEQHRQVAVSAQIEREEDVFVPEDVDLLAAVAGLHRVDRFVVVGALVVQRAHPVTDGGGDQQAAEIIAKPLRDRMASMRSLHPNDV